MAMTFSPWKAMDQCNYGTRYPIIIDIPAAETGESFAELWPFNWI